MPWNGEPGAGFSPAGAAAEPWLPIPEAHCERAVAVQENDPGSVLATCRQLLHWRRQQPALQKGAIRMLDVPEPGLALIRSHENEHIVAAFNLSGQTLSIELPAELLEGLDIGDGEVLTGHGLHDLASGPNRSSIDLSPYGVYFCRLLTS